MSNPIASPPEANRAGNRFKTDDEIARQIVAELAMAEFSSPGHWSLTVRRLVSAALRQARAEERERCAQVLDEYGGKYPIHDTGAKVAARIRALGDDQ